MEQCSRATQILSFLIVLQSLNIAIADGLTTSGCQNKRTVVQCVALVIGGVMLYSFSSLGGVIGRHTLWFYLK